MYNLHNIFMILIIFIFLYLFFLHCCLLYNLIIRKEKLKHSFNINHLQYYLSENDQKILLVKNKHLFLSANT